MTFTTVLLLLACMLCNAIPNTLKKSYKKNTPIFFTSVCICFSLLFFLGKFLIENKGFNFSVDLGVLKYAIPFGVCFALASVFIYLAFKFGDLSLTGLLTSFSLLLPTFYGIIFLGDDVGIFFYLGLALFIACLVLTNVKFLDKDKEKEKKPVSVKWVICVIVGSVANGGCSLIQTMQQKAYGGKGGSELMIIALTFALIALLIVAFCIERDRIKDALKPAFALGAPCGLLVGCLNALVMVFTGQNLLPVSVFFPLHAGGVLLITFVFGYFFYKDRYDWLQYIGLFCGVASVIMLNL